MMKRIMRNQKGISLITLSITVIVLLIITNIVVYNLQDNLGTERLRNMQNDIENLRDKIDSYYLQYGTIPIIDKEYTNTEQIDVKGANDTGKFYVIDLSALENLTLTYGEGYREISDNSTDEQINALEDIYIINEASHNVFYVKGITVDDKTYYTDYTTNDEGYVDMESIDIRYVDGIKIPEGYKYLSGDSVENLKIRKLENDKMIYDWVSVENPEDIKKINAYTVSKNKLEEFEDSVNTYKGYYLFKGPGLIAWIEKEGEKSWSPVYNEEAKYTDKNGDTAIIPKGFQVSISEGRNTVQSGLVARNKNTDNRYVWIEVPKSIYKTAMSSEDYTNIEKDMKDYAKDYIVDDYVFDTWDSNNCAITSEKDYNDLKNKMLKSVYENGGFWISQYEIGTDEIRSSTSTISNKKAYSQEGKYPFNYITCTDAQTISKTIENNIGDRQTSLLFGIQWKLILKDIEEKGGKTQTEIKNNSTSWGNYLSIGFNIYKNIEYSTNNGQTYTTPSSYPYSKSSTTNTLLTTGTTTRNRVLNIYDLAGNIGEWTLERGYNSHGVYGGSYKESNTYALYRINGTNNYSTGEQIKESDIGFRVALY